MLEKIKEKPNQAKEFIKTQWKKIVAILGIGVALAAGSTLLPDTSFEDLSNVIPIENGKFRIDYITDEKERTYAEIGNKAVKEWKPEVFMSKWDEVSLIIKPTPEFWEDKEVVPIQENEKLKFVNGDKEIHIYPLPASEQMENGGLEYEVILNSKPASNIILLDIETEGLDFFYQPELTQKEKDEGAFRPENVVGSYAVYCSEQKTNWEGGKLYRAGKVGHIYRPKIIDSAGKETWGILNIDKGILSVEIPQEFLDNVVYPISIDPTFGYTTAGVSVYSASDYLYTYPYVANGSGTITNLTFYSANPYPEDAFIFIIYNASNRVDYTQEFTAIYTTQWKVGTAQLGGSVVSGTTYYMGIFSASNYEFSIFYDTDTGAYNQYQAVTYVYPPPATWTKTQSSYSRKFSIYCTYTAAGAARRIIITE